MRQHLEPFLDVQGPRLELPARVVLTAEAAQAIGLRSTTGDQRHQIWSAVRFHPASQNFVVFDSTATSLFNVSWIERGGPAVAPPSQQGFGHVVMNDMIERSSAGKSQ